MTPGDELDPELQEIADGWEDGYLARIGPRERAALLSRMQGGISPPPRTELERYHAQPILERRIQTALRMARARAVTAYLQADELPFAPSIRMTVELSRVLRTIADAERELERIQLGREL